MKAIVNSKALHSALKKLSNSYSNTQIMPVLSNVKLTFSGTVLSLTLTNLDVTSVSQVECATDIDDSILIPYEELTRVSGAFPDVPLTFDVKENGSVSITSGKDKYHIAKIDDVSYYPSVPFIGPSVEVEVDGSFFESINTAIAFIAPEDYRLNMICVDIDPSGINICALDTRILFFKRIACETGVTKQRLLISKSFAQSVKYFKSGKLSFNENFVLISSLNMDVFGRMGDKGFPQYEILTDKAHEYNLIVEVADLDMSLNKILACKSTISLYLSDFSIKKNTMSISLVEESKQMNTDIQVQTDLSLDIRLNARQLKTILSNLPAETKNISMSFFDFKRIVYIKSDADDTAEYIITPISTPQ